MSVIYKSQNVDEVYAPQLEANLYYNDVLVPGVTCDDSFTYGPAGGIYVHKLATGTTTPVAPGTDFTDVESSDSLIQIVLNNAFQRSKKIYNAQAAAMAADIKSANLAEAQASVREGWMQSGLACLANEATAITLSADEDDAKAMVLEARQKVVEGKGHADVVMCSPAFYAKVLKAAGTEFTPNRNEAIASTGNVGVWLGMTFVEAAGMVDTAAKYYDYTGTLKTVNLSGVSFVIYAHETLSAITNVDMARIIDSENFNGCKAQVEINSGFRVRNAALAYKA